MIAEATALDAGVINVAAVATLLVIVAGGAWWAATMASGQKSIAKDVHSIQKSVKDLGFVVDHHREEDDTKHSEQARRLDRLELLTGHDLTPIRGIPLDRTPTGPQDRLRGDTPRPRRREDTGETGSGESR